MNLDVKRHFFLCIQTNQSMDEDKKSEKNLENKVLDDKNNDTVLLDGKALHDLYRHTAKLIK